MKLQTIRRTLAALAVAGAVISLSACGSGSAITRARIERSLPQTFANLYVQQAKLLGREGVSAQSLKARAYCDKGGPAIADQGPGADWTCLMSWDDPNVQLTDGTGKFELNVHSNDCYTASGPSKIVGLLTVTDTRGNDVPNPVFEFDSCFDPNSSNARLAPSAEPAALTLPTGDLKPTANGQILPELTCSPGAAGGCAGTLTASVGQRVVGTVRYQLPADGTNTFPFSIPSSQRQNGTEIVLTATPLIGTVRNNSASVAVSDA